MEIPFTLKWRYCHIGFVDAQHNFEITYLNLNYVRCPAGVLQQRKHLRMKMTYLFMTDINNNNK